MTPEPQHDNHKPYKKASTGRIKWPKKRNSAVKNLPRQQQIALLEQLCRELDPYQKLSKAHCKILKQLNVDATLDPFQLTNELVFRLENAIDETSRESQL